MRTCFLFILIFPVIALSQNSAVDKWVEQLKDQSNAQFKNHYAVYLDLQKLDTLARLKAAINIYDKCAKGNKRLRLIGKSVKAKVFFYNKKADESICAAEMQRCLLEAIEMEEPYLQAEFGRWYSEMLNTLGQKELAVQYATTSLKLHEYLGYQNFAAVSIFYMWVGETLLVAGYLPEAIGNLHKGLQLAKTDSLVRPFRFMFTYNNLGLAYRNLNQHDSALHYFEKLKAYCVEINRPDWVEIAYKNRLPCFVALGMLDSAKVVTSQLFNIANTSNEPEDEMIAWEMRGKIAVIEGDYKNAVKHLMQSVSVNGGKNPKLLCRVYESLASTYEKMGQPEKAYTYSKALGHINDRLNRERVNYNSRFLVIKADYEKEQLKFRQMATNAQYAIRNRNIGIAILVFIFMLGIWWLNRRRKKAQSLQQQSAKQLEQFKGEMISKNNQLESLMASQQVLQNRQQNTIRIDELSQQMILTEDDWQNFKQLFEKTYPAFFSSLRQKAPGITEAEQRMAALLKIQLNTKQIAAMQGISPDSVHKTRHRLRQRFSSASTAELENIIAAL